MKTVFFLALATLLPYAAQAERFEEGNSPTFFKKLAGTEMILNLKQLPTNGEQLDDRYGWSETYWPANVGGIAYRWSSPNPEPFKYKFNSNLCNSDNIKQKNDFKFSYHFGVTLNK